MQKIAKPTNYIEFKDYIKKIVLFQATNKKFAGWSNKRKATINFTTRQLEKVTGIPKSTCHRYLRKMRKEKLIFFASSKKTSDKRFSNMVFYYHQEVINILKSIAKKRTYTFIKRSLKDMKDSGTLKINLLHKLKENGMNLQFLPDSNLIRLYFDRNEYNLNEIDLRTKTMIKKRKTINNPNYIKNFFSSLSEKYL